MSKDFDLDEIRKRQKELVEMKKVKQGQVEAPHVDLNEEKIIPHTPKEKAQNFWYHYKWVTLGSLAALGLLVFFIIDMVTKPRYDIEIMAFNKYQTLFDTDKLTASFSKFAIDTDDNGEINVLINGNQMMDPTASGLTMNAEMAQASATRLFAGLQTFEGFIFLMDESTYDTIVMDDTGERLDVFLDLSEYTDQNPAFQGDKLYLKDTQFAADWYYDGANLEELPDDLFLCLRDYTKADRQREKLQTQYQNEKEVFDKIVQSVLNEGKDAANAE